MESYPRQCAHNGVTYTEEIESNIRVSQPVANQTVGKNITIKGEARVYENNVNYRVRDASGLVLAEGYITAQALDIGQFGPFEITTALKPPAVFRGQVEVYSESANDGSEINTVTIPVEFATTDFATTTVKLNFIKKDDPMLDCTVTYAVNRVVPKTEGIARLAIEELLKGPTDADDRAGYTTALNAGVKINKLTVVNGVARVDFDQKIQDQVGGSCRVQAIRAQISDTLKQFPTVKSVVITVDGKEGDVLQP